MRTLPMLLLVASVAAAQSPKPLQARVLPPYRGQLAFEVGERAYVAIYSMNWGGRTPTLLYYSPAKSPETPGEHTLPRGRGYLFHNASEYRVVTTLVLIASRTPLDLHDYPTRVLGDSTLANATDAAVIIDRLVQLITPAGSKAAVDSYIWRQ